MRVGWEFEEVYYEDTGDGKRIKQKREGEETLAERTETVSFHLRDLSRQIKVDPERAEIIAQIV